MAKRSIKIKTPHGELSGPIFMPDATYGAVKSLSMQDLSDTGTEAFVTTTLHLEQQLDSAYIKQYGGLHKLLNWNRPIITDSGGFQVFSLIHARANNANRLSEAGCSFINHRTGAYQFLSPEISMQIQFNLGSDIYVVLDEPTPADASLSMDRTSVQRTTRWAKRCKDEFLRLHNLSEADFNNPQIERPLLCCVVQGGNNFDLRRESALSLVEIGFDVYGFGGAPLLKEITWKDDPKSGKFFEELLAHTVELLPTDKPRYALGVGTPDDIAFCINAGWDLFDTVLPSRNARHGLLYTEKGDGDKDFATYSTIHIRSERYKFDDTPINSKSKFTELRETSRAYLRHLMRIGEAAGYRLATLNNLEFYQQLVST